MLKFSAFAFLSVLLATALKPSFGRESGLPALAQACYIHYPTHQNKEISCTGTLIGRRLVVTAEHCFTGGLKAIQGKIEIGCGFLSDRSIDRFNFIEEFTADGLRLSGNSEETHTDFAFLRLNRAANRILPLPVVTNLKQFKESFASPRNGLKGNLGNGTVFLSSFGDSFMQPRHGDSGGPLYCRTTPQAPWELIAVLSMGNSSNVSLWAVTTSREFRDFLNYIKKIWI